MTNYDVLLVNAEASSQIISSADEGLVIVEANAEIEILVPLDSFDILDVAVQGAPGPRGPQ